MSVDAGMPYGARASMEPVGYTVELRAGELDERFTISCEDVRDMAGDQVSVEASFDGEVVDIAIVAHVDVTVETFQVVLRHAFATEELVLMNGYQSWTDTVERPAWSRMRGLKLVPNRIVDVYVLDGGGDYRFTDYERTPGRMHGFTYATFRRGDGLVLVGSLDESHGFTTIRTDARAGLVKLETECPRRRIAAGSRVTLGSYAITRGTVEVAYDRWFELSGIVARPASPLVGYTSWYRHFGDISEEKLQVDYHGLISQLDGFDTSGMCRLFQIDDGYCKVGDWLEVDERKFPRGLSPLARAIERAGIVPGLWAAPFVCEVDSRLAAEHPSWILRDETGAQVRAGSQWSGSLALDTRNPEVRSYVLEVLQTMTREWGFKLLKLDFLYAACLVEHDGMNRGELMVDAVDLLRRGMGEDCLLLACGVPLASVFGRAEYCRIGCDVGLDWNDKPFMRVPNRERVSTKNSLANTRGRAPLDGRAFGCDPDVFFLRDDVKLTTGQQDELLRAAAEFGSVFLTSDNMDLWSDSARNRYAKALGLFRSRFCNG